MIWDLSARVLRIGEFMFFHALKGKVFKESNVWSIDLLFAKPLSELAESVAFSGFYIVPRHVFTVVFFGHHCPPLEETTSPLDAEPFKYSLPLCSVYKTKLASWIRWALTQSVHAHVRCDSELSRFYHRLTKRKRKQVAVVATARKMLEPLKSSTGCWRIRSLFILCMRRNVCPRPKACGLNRVS
jgi:hypothetical protein